MKNLQCPKCRSVEVIRLPEDLQAPTMISGAKPPSSYKPIKVTRYCCANCGYTEVWANEPDDLKNLLSEYGF